MQFKKKTIAYLIYLKTYYTTENSGEEDSFWDNYDRMENIEGHLFWDNYDNNKGYTNKMFRYQLNI